MLDDCGISAKSWSLGVTWMRRIALVSPLIQIQLVEKCIEISIVAALKLARSYPMLILCDAIMLTTTIAQNVFVFFIVLRNFAGTTAFDFTPNGSTLNGRNCVQFPHRFRDGSLRHSRCSGGAFTYWTHVCFLVLTLKANEMCVCVQPYALNVQCMWNRFSAYSMKSELRCRVRPKRWSANVQMNETHEQFWTQNFLTCPRLGTRHCMWWKKT